MNHEEGLLMLEKLATGCTPCAVMIAHGEQSSVRFAGSVAQYSDKAIELFVGEDNSGTRPTLQFRVYGDLKNVEFEFGDTRNLPRETQDAMETGYGNSWLLMRLPAKNIALILCFNL